ncbi:MAG: class V aminotransferase [bacterium]|nr:MAG: class V aminotransferase [bacterium]
MNEEIRKLFPIIENYLYLNHAAITPYSTLVDSAISNISRDIAYNGSTGWHNWMAKISSTRLLVSKLIGAQAENIAFMRNTSDAISSIANGISWQVGDNIVSCEIEFPANIYPWMRLEKQGVELRLLPATKNRRIDPEAIFNLVDAHTRVIALSWVQYSSGFRSDLKTIGKFCQERNILFCVDAIQGLGALELNVEDDFVDTLAADAHKFLMGPEGLGIMYLSDRALKQIQPTVVGWLSVKNKWEAFEEKSSFKLDYAPGALSFECGTPNTIGIYALHAALELILKVGQKQIEEHLLNLSEYLYKKLSELGFETLQPTKRQEMSAIVCCRHSKIPPEVIYKKLSAQKIICAPRCGWLRISPHFYINYNDIDRLIASLEIIAKENVM